MKWSIVGLLLLGVVAAISATVLVASLLSSQAQKKAEEAPPPVVEVEVLVAKKGLPAIAVVGPEDVATKKVPKDQVPSDSVSNAVQIVGRVLVLPMVEGQPFTKSIFATEGSGVHLAAALPNGMRAVSVTLSEYSGLENSLYAGSVVDVIVTFNPPAASKRGAQLISTTLLRGIQVLAVGGRSIVSPMEEVTGQVKKPSSRSGRQRPKVTLMVGPREAKLLQLAMQKGKVSLVMRNPLDNEKDDSGVVALRDLADEGSSTAMSEGLMAMLQAAQGAAQPIEPQDANQSKPQPEPEPQWQTTILRAGQIETLSFPMPKGRKVVPTG